MIELHDISMQPNVGPNVSQQGIVLTSTAGHVHANHSAHHNATADQGTWYTADEGYSGLNEPHTLARWTLLRWLTTTFALSLPLPTGLMKPLLTLGALSGQCLGILTTKFDGGRIATYLPLIGAVSFTAAVTRSFSVVILAMELTVLPRAFLPMSAAAILAIVVANRYSNSLYETRCVYARLPLTPKPRSYSAGCAPVNTVMNTDVPMVPEYFGGGGNVLAAALEKYPEWFGFGVAAGGTEGMEFAPVIGFVLRKQVEAVASDPDPKEVMFKKDGMLVAPQTHPWMEIRNCLRILDMYGGAPLFVTEGGCVVGVVSHEDLLHAVSYDTDIGAQAAKPTGKPTLRVLTRRTVVDD